MSPAMLWPLPAVPVYGAYCFVQRALRTMYWTAATYFYISVVGLDPLRLVLVGTALEIVILLGEVPTGVVADVYSRRLSVVIGVFLMGLGFALDGWLAAFWATLLAQIVWGLGVTFTSGAAAAWIADECQGRDLGRVYLRGSQLEGAGSLLGVAAGVALSYAGLALTMIAAGAGLMLFAGVLAATMPERGFAPAPRGARATWRRTRATLLDGYAAIRGSTALIAFTGLLLFYFMGSESFDRLWEMHLLAVGLPAVPGMTPVAWFGVVSAGGVLLGIVAAEALRHGVDRAGERALVRLLVGLTALTALGMVAFGLAPSFAAAVAAYWSATVARQLFPAIANAWVNRHIPSEVRATVLSFGSQADAAGQIAGGPIFGWMASAHSTALALAVAGACLVPGIPLLLRALPAEGRRPPAA